MMQAVFRKLGLSRADSNKSAAGAGGLHVTEAVGGNWHYHLSKPGINGRGLCGALTMYTAVPLSAWGVKDHLGETYCAACAEAGAAELAAAQA